MNDKDNDLKTAELSAVQNDTRIGGISPAPGPEDRPPDKVKPPTEKKRSRERER